MPSAASESHKTRSPAKWKAEIGVFFQGVGPDAPDEELRRIAPGYPVFRLRDR